MKTPLADLKVISLEQYGAGPFSTMQLADLGAQVIKVENPREGGDVGRYVPPYAEGRDSLFFQSLNRNKSSIALDITDDSGRDVFHDLVRSADAVFYNLRGDLAEKLKLRYTDLADINPKIVCCSLSGFGTTGPRAAEAGYDYLIQGLTGWMSLTGEPDAPPTKSGLSLVDLSGGYVAAIALLSAVWRARRDGHGCDCDVSLFETAMAELTYVGTWAASTDYRPTRHSQSAHPSIVPFQLFATSDGHVVVACAKEKFWQRLRDMLLDDNTLGPRVAVLGKARFDSMALRTAHRDELVAVLSQVFRTRTTKDWVDRLSSAGVPNGPVNDIAAALSDAQTVAREAVVEVPHETWGVVRHLATPLRLSGPTTGIRQAPAYGADTHSVLGDLGYDEDLIAHLEARGVVYADPGCHGKTATSNSINDWPAS